MDFTIHEAPNPNWETVYLLRDIKELLNEIAILNGRKVVSPESVDLKRRLLNQKKED